MAVGRRLKQLRAAGQVSMNRVHLETHMSTSYLSKLERDEFVPGEENLKRIVRALKKLGVDDADTLFEEHQAVLRERAALSRIEERLAAIDDPGKRLGMINAFLADLDTAGEGPDRPRRRRKGS